MKTSSKFALGVAAALILALVGLLIYHQPTVSDQDQIAAQLESARAAVQDRNAGGVMKIVSADFKGPDPIENVDRLNIFLRQVFNKSGQFQLTMSPPNVVVQGDSATSTSQVAIKDADTGQTPLRQPLTLLWRREEGRRYLIFPVKVWRVVGAQYQGDLPGLE